MARYEALDKVVATKCAVAASKKMSRRLHCGVAGSFGVEDRSSTGELEYEKCRRAFAASTPVTSWTKVRGRKRYGDCVGWRRRLWVCRA